MRGGRFTLSWRGDDIEQLHTTLKIGGQLRAILRKQQARRMSSHIPDRDKIARTGRIPKADVAYAIEESDIISRRRPGQRGPADATWERAKRSDLFTIAD